jgi:cytochrome c
MKSRNLISTLIVIIMMIYSSLIINSAFAQSHSKKTTIKAKKPTVAEIEEGKVLISKSDCLSCHKLNIKLIGPAYKDVAAKYPANEANYVMLTQKIINGGIGVWGQVAMTPHPNLPPADVKKMIKYILTIE